MSPLLLIMRLEPKPAAMKIEAIAADLSQLTARLVSRPPARPRGRQSIKLAVSTQPLKD